MVFKGIVIPLEGAIKSIKETLPINMGPDGLGGHSPDSFATIEWASKATFSSVASRNAR